MQLRRFYFAHRELFVIPVEHLGEGGMSDSFAAALREERGVDDEWIALFDRAYATYWERAASLYARAPDSWFPPRLQNLAIVLEPDATRPYYQPFHKSSWMLYASDFDPAQSNVEFATYQLLHAERLSTSRDMAMAIICSMSYWLERSDEEIEAFTQACGRSSRPDASAFGRIAEAMPWIRELYHDPLRRPPQDVAASLRRVKEAGLYVPPELQSKLHAMVPALRGDAAAVMERFLETSAAIPPTDPAVAMASSPAEFLCDWLVRRRPPLLLTDESDRTLWDPDAPTELSALRRALEGIGGRAAQSLQADLKVVGDRSATFLASLRRPERLPAAGDDVEQEGGVYVHETRPLVVYSLAQPGIEPVKEAAPPYHRLLVGARTIHEWGHLSEDAGWLGLPAEREEEHRRAREAIAAAVDALLDAAPKAFGAAARDEADKARKTPGEFVCSMVLSRMSDFLSNMLARRYLPPEELEAYIRANVYTHFGEDARPLHLLARYAYEYQYLSLSQIEDPLRYMLRSTWLSDYFVDTGLMSREHLVALLEATGRLCACYEVDESAFMPPAGTGA